MCADHLLEPIANFAAVSVVKNEKKICFTVLISKLPPFFFLPVIKRRIADTKEDKRAEKPDNIE